MKKFFAYAMAALMVLGLASCGNENEPEQKDAKSNEVAIAVKLCGTTQEQSTAILSKEGYILALAFDGMRMYIPADKQSVFTEYSIAAAKGEMSEETALNYLKQIGRTFSIIEDEEENNVIYAQYGTSAEASKAEKTWGDYVTSENLSSRYEYQTEKMDDTTILFGFLLSY